jgi:prepilin-type N-terminal cleavage/methylation domain-containing protein
MPKLSKNNGFTLVELLIVMVVVGILATIATARYTGVLEKGYSAEAYSALAQIVSAENVYKLENTDYTTTFTDLDLDITDPENISPNFKYSVSSTAADAYAKADHTKTNKATNDYYMCLNGGNHSTSCPP